MRDYTTKRTTETDLSKDSPKGRVTKSIEEVQAWKTPWDYLQLAGTVAVPLVLGLGGFWLNQQEQKRVEAREKEDKDRDAKNLEREQERAEESYRQEQKRAEENLREEALQTYLDRISELLLNNNLGNLNQENNPAQDIARARTLTVLERLGQDGERKAAILRFLFEAELLNQPKTVVNLRGANLVNINLSGAVLSEAKLRGLS